MIQKFRMDLKANIIIALVFMVLGFMLTVQFKTTERQKNVRIARVEDLSERLRVAEAEKNQLRKELADLRKHSGHIMSDAELERLNLLAGTSEVYGPGLEIVLDDSTTNQKVGENPNLYIVHDEDLLRILNELRAAGAEAISVNDQRIGAMSELRCAGPTVSINNVRSAPPYVIKAIGDPKTMASALRLRGGVVDTFAFWGIDVKIKDSNKIVVPAQKAIRAYEYAKQTPKEDRK